jgi:hypothetical protein
MFTHDLLSSGAIRVEWRAIARHSSDNAPLNRDERGAVA